MGGSGAENRPVETTERPARRPGVQQDHVLPFWDLGGGAYFGYRMAIATRLFDRRIVEILAEHGGFTLPQWRVLAQLGLMEVGTVRSLADGAIVDRSEASRALKDLESTGYVLRNGNPQDGRSPHFSLSDKGQRQFEIMRQPISRFIQNLVDGVPPEDVEAANRVLWKVTLGCLGDPP